jgi:Family of unknown function (DUF5994)
MMSAPTRSGTISRDINLEDLHPRLRLRLKPQGPTGGHVDGGWWPRSRDLAAELPSLLAVLAVRLGRIERFTYHLTDWRPAPRTIICGGGVVRLGGYRTQPAGTVNVLADSQRVTLLVVPPQTPPQNAHAALMAAGHRGNTDDVEALLAACLPTTPLFDGEREAALERWELDGGHGR